MNNERNLSGRQESPEGLMNSERTLKEWKMGKSRGPDE